MLSKVVQTRRTLALSAAATVNWGALHKRRDAARLSASERL